MDKVVKTDQAAEIAKQKQAEITNQKDAAAKAEKEKQEAEARGAAEGSPPKPEKTKDEQIKEAGEKAVAQAKTDEAILAKEEKDLTEEDKARKAELLNVKKEKDVKTDEVKEKARREKIEKRFDEMTAIIKKLEADGNTKNGEYKKLQAETAELKKQLKPEETTEVNVLKKAETERVTKYLDEDKGKPREERREMSNEELNDWLGEDLAAGNAWLMERTLRRSDERKEDKGKLQQGKVVKDFLEKQHSSFTKTVEKYPELNTKARIAELTSQGIDKDEIEKTLRKERPNYKLCMEILDESPELYMSKENGPELVIAEMEKRSKKPAETDDEKKKRETEAAKKQREDELQKVREEAAEAERIRLERLDQGPAGGQKEMDEPVKKTALEEKQIRIAKKAGISEKRLGELVERRKKIPGANAGLKADEAFE